MRTRTTRSTLRTLVASALALSLVAGAGMAWAGPGSDEGDAHHQRHHERSQERLDRALDTIGAEGEQRASLEALAQEGRELSRASRAETRDEAFALFAQLTSSAPDREVVHDLVNTLSASRTKNGHAMVDLALSAHSILTPKQRDAIAARLDTPWPAFGGSWFIDMGVARVLGEIEADDAQRELVGKHKASIEREVGALIEWRNTVAPQLATLIRSDEPDADLAHGLLDKASLRVTAFAHDATDAAVDIATALDDDQRAQLVEMAKSRRGRR